MINYHQIQNTSPAQDSNTSRDPIVFRAVANQLNHQKIAIKNAKSVTIEQTQKNTTGTLAGLTYVYDTATERRNCDKHTIVNTRADDISDFKFVSSKANSTNIISLECLIFI